MKQLPMNMAQKVIQAIFCILTSNNIQALNMKARNIYIYIYIYMYNELNVSSLHTREVTEQKVITQQCIQGPLLPFPPISFKPNQGDFNNC